MVCRNIFIFSLILVLDRSHSFMVHPLSVSKSKVRISENTTTASIKRHWLSGDAYTLHPRRDNESIPNYVDWRTQNAVSPVKDQGRCAACWAFSLVANIESHRAIEVRQKDILSEQFLIDCIPDSPGCGDGSLIKLFSDIVSKLGGVLKQEDYPPYQQNRGACRWDKSNSVKPVTGFKRVHPDEQSMMKALFEHGPLSVAINSASMGKYTDGGVVDEPTADECPPDKLDHAVLIVGYSAAKDEDGREVPYWIVKNSWGNQWGDKGYYYIVRGKNACGIETDVSFAYVN